MSDDKSIAIAPDIPPEMAEIMRLAVSKGEEGVAALERLVALHERAQDKVALGAYNTAMLAVQSELPQVVKNAQNDQTRSLYARLEMIDRAIRPHYTQHGFQVSFTTEDCPTPDWIRHVALCGHVGGHTQRYQLDLPRDDVGMKGNPMKTQIHGVGSSLTYGQRRLTCMIFNVVLAGEDTDGVVRDTVPVTAEQAADLRALAEEVDADVEKFLKFFRTDTFAGVRATDYRRAVQLLEAKRKQSLRGST